MKDKGKTVKIASKVKAKGGVHYSFPSQEYDIKAELEINFKG
jgi:hypothetical protein